MYLDIGTCVQGRKTEGMYGSFHCKKKRKNQKQSAVILEGNKGFPLNWGSPGNNTFQPLKI